VLGLQDALREKRVRVGLKLGAYMADDRLSSACASACR
jgi:hypothetical protein